MRIERRDTLSNWTHVAAIFRIDGIRFSGDEPDFKKLFGKELHWKDSADVWGEAKEHPENFLPYGSEGSLEMSVWTNPDIHCVTAYTVSIFGDLGDHDSIGEIIKWFDEKCKAIEEVEILRQAVVTVENERYGVRTRSYGG